MKRFLIEIIGALTLIIVLVELFFRCVIPAPDLPQKEQNVSFDIFRFTPASYQGLFTFGRTAQIQANFNVNKQGYISTFDYQKDETAIPLLGDSYVSSLYTNTLDNIDQKLMREMDLRLYNLGMPGANLAEYKKYMDYAHSEFDCKKFIVLISNGDLLESYKSISTRKYERQLAILDDSILVVNSKPFKKGTIGRILYKSALFRYLTTNISLTAQKSNDPVILADYTQELLKINEYLLHEMTEKYEVLFLLQGQKPFIYYDSVRSKENELILSQLKKGDYNYIDLNAIFREVYLEDNTRFEFEINDHWNAYGNEIVSKAISDYFNLNKLR